MAEFRIEILNTMAKEAPSELIKKSEDAYHNFIENIAKTIARDKKIGIILLAGPSGSGKTTSANLISDAIEKNGRHSFVVSLDDFYRNNDDPDYPKTEAGEADFEAPGALDIQELVKTLRAVANGEDFYLPKFDFKKKARTKIEKHIPIGGGVIIIEGLHALNPEIFTHLPKEKLLKIFISVSTNITKNGEVILSGRKIRFIRRLTRDSLYRGTDAESTLSMWKNVLLGEDKYLYPNRKYADVSFDTFHPFELGAMRAFAENLITDDLASKDDYARTVKNALHEAEPIKEELIPQNSLIREFIPGGIYENLY